MITEAATVKELKKNLENAVEFINKFCLKSDIVNRFNLNLGLMVLLWNTDMITMLSSLEIDIRGALDLDVEPLDPASDTGATASPVRLPQQAEDLATLMADQTPRPIRRS